MSFCCQTFQRRGRWLFTSIRHMGVETASFCPWCGKGVTSAPIHKDQPPPSVSQQFQISRKTANWPKGNPTCTVCAGRGYFVKRVGCCSLNPVPCSCVTAKTAKTTGGQA